MTPSVQQLYPSAFHRDRRLSLTLQKEFTALVMGAAMPHFYGGKVFTQHPLTLQKMGFDMFSILPPVSYTTEA